MTRLPNPGGDDGTWGDILNAFLGVEHNADGSLKNVIRTSDSRLTDARTPLDGSVTNAKIAVGAAIDPAKIAGTVIVSSDSSLKFPYLRPDIYGISPSASDNASLIQNAISDAVAAGGGTVLLPPGTLTTSQILLPSNVALVGSGKGTTVLQLKSGSVGSLIRSSTFAANTGGSSTGGDAQFSIERLTLDGGGSGNTSATRALEIYGYGFLIRDVEIRFCKTDGVYVEHAGGFPSGAHIEEATLDNVHVHHTGGINIIWNGPTDARWNNVVAAVSGTGSHNIHVKSLSSGLQAVNCHAWGAQSDWGWYIEASSCFFADCEGEGATSGMVFMGSQGCSWLGGRVFAPASAATVGFQIGDGSHTAARNNRINSQAVGFAGGAVNFAIDNGYGEYVIQAIDCSDPPYVGTPAGSSYVEFLIGKTSTPSVIGAARYRTSRFLFTNHLQITGGNLVFTHLLSPTAAPTVTATNPNSGSTSYLYKIVSSNSEGDDATPSPTSSNVNNASSLDSNSFNVLSWTPVTNAAWQKVIVSIDSGSTWKLVATVAGAASSYTDNSGTGSTYALATSAVGGAISADGNLTVSAAGTIIGQFTGTTFPNIRLQSNAAGALNWGTAYGIGRDSNAAIVASGSGGFYVMRDGATKTNSLDDSTGAVRINGANSGIYSGTGVPSNANGSNGDLYLRSDGGPTSTIYQKYGSVWTSMTTNRAQKVVEAQGFITEAYPRLLAGGSAITGGTVYLVPLFLVAGETVTNVHVAVTTAGGTGTSTLCKVGLYDTSGNRLASSVDQGSAWETASTKTHPLSSPYTPATSGVVLVALVGNNSGTLPQLARVVNAGQIANPIGSGIRPYYKVTSQTDLPTSLTLAAGDLGIWVAVS